MSTSGRSMTWPPGRRARPRSPSPSSRFRPPSTRPGAADMRASWRILARHRDLRLVLSAALVSRSGDWILLTGLLYRVYAMTGSTVASALTMLSAFVPQVLLGPVAGAFADRWNRKLTMIVADLLLAAGLLPLLAVHGSGQVPIVFAVLVWEG